MEPDEVFVVFDEVRNTVDYVSSLELLAEQARDRFVAKARLNNLTRDYKVTTLAKALSLIHCTYTYAYDHHS